MSRNQCAFIDGDAFKKLESYMNSITQAKQIIRQENAKSRDRDMNLISIELDSIANLCEDVVAILDNFSQCYEYDELADVLIRDYLTKEQREELIANQQPQQEK